MAATPTRHRAPLSGRGKFGCWTIFASITLLLAGLPPVSTQGGSGSGKRKNTNAYNKYNKSSLTSSCPKAHMVHQGRLRPLAKGKCCLTLTRSRHQGNQRNQTLNQNTQNKIKQGLSDVLSAGLEPRLETRSGPARLCRSRS